MAAKENQLESGSIVWCPDHTPRGERWSGEQSRISWAYYRNVVRNNEFARLLNNYVVITLNTRSWRRQQPRAFAMSVCP